MTPLNLTVQQLVAQILIQECAIQRLTFVAKGQPLLIETIGDPLGALPLLAHHLQRTYGHLSLPGDPIGRIQLRRSDDALLGVRMQLLEPPAANETHFLWVALALLAIDDWAERSHDRFIDLDLILNDLLDLER